MGDFEGDGICGGAASSSGPAWDEFRILTEAAAVGRMGAWAFDVADELMWLSDEAHRILAFDPSDAPITLERFTNAVHPDDRTSVECLLRSGDAVPSVVEHRIVRRSGELRHVRSSGAMRPTSTAAARVVGVTVDITEERNLRRALADSEERYRLLVENAYDVIWTMELDGSISYVSPAVERVRGFSPEEACLQSIDEISPPDSAARVKEYFDRLFAAIAGGAEPPTYRGELEYFRKDGSIMVGDLQVIPQLDADGHPVCILGVTRDISAQRRYESELTRIAVTDALTGAWNRRHGRDLLDAEVEEFGRYGTPVSLLVLDVDHFKKINDRHGHQVGDDVLIELCRRLNAHLRPSDALVRWGGEEFLVVARHSSLDAGVALADKLVELVARTAFGTSLSVTISVGVAELRRGDDLDGWLHRADEALYRAKAAGRNRACASA